MVLDIRVRLPAETGSTGHTATNRGVLTPRSACWRTRKVYAVHVGTINPAYVDFSYLGSTERSQDDRSLLRAVLGRPRSQARFRQERLAEKCMNEADLAFLPAGVLFDEWIADRGLAHIARLMLSRHAMIARCRVALPSSKSRRCLTRSISPSPMHRRVAPSMVSAAPSDPNGEPCRSLRSG